MLHDLKQIFIEQHNKQRTQTLNTLTVHNVGPHIYPNKQFNSCLIYALPLFW